MKLELNDFEETLLTLLNTISVNHEKNKKNEDN